ncbi:MAG: DNA-binding response regulator [Chloroflexi bacterium HGW-Chloroflexi-3]|nr:MAG: DNA-binding response regulator [Chloroflexi bacterium HGW-Chloroflexi-3]
MIKIVLADDHTVVREGFRMVLETQPEFMVIGEACDGLEAIQVVEHLKPDVLVVDLMMPGINGLEVVRQVHRITRVVVLTMHDHESYVLEALRNGAYGYVLKDATPKELVEAIQKAAIGQHYLSAPFADRAIELYAQMHVNAGDSYDTLSDREREVLQLAGQGYSNQEIGEMLKISSRTVEVHRAKLMRKLNIKGQTELIRYAIQHGLKLNQ